MEENELIQIETEEYSDELYKEAEGVVTENSDDGVGELPEGAEEFSGEGEE